jgi:hypothetical protein
MNENSNVFPLRQPGNIDDPVTDLSARHYVYAWADGIYLQARMEEHSDCLLGAEPGRR